MSADAPALPLDSDTDAAPAGAADRLQPRGSSQGGLRQYNERVVLQAVRLHGGLPGAEIARLTGLTAQTVSMISKRLLEDGLLRKGEPQRGKVGQPSVPLLLHPDGAYAVGVKIGRRSMDVVLVDFTGQVRQRWPLDYEHADPDPLLATIAQRVKEIRRKLGPAGAAALQGIGIATPLNLGGWQSLLGLPVAVAQKWRHCDLRAEVAQRTGLPALLVKDTAAAAVAELIAGRGRSLKSFLYVFVDTFIGGGLVLDSQLRGGLSGNAGAIGSLSLALPGDDQTTHQPPQQLLRVASLLTLERAYLAAGLAPEAVGDDRALQAPWLPHTQAWLVQAGAAIAMAVQAGACLLDLQGVIVDGNFSRGLLQALLAASTEALARHDWEGVTRPPLLAGTIGSDARALGGALLPLHANFSPDRELFLKA